MFSKILLTILLCTFIIAVILNKEVIPLTQKVRFSAADDVREFVDAASQCDFDIDVSYDKIVVDAKSLLGILSMDLRRDFFVTCHGENALFTKTLEKFSIA
ncbi:MAG: HPr family phosphocarrier protein [Blautia sp.]|nr:HPr family phosphocarrier protein [Blautia sp.]